LTLTPTSLPPQQRLLVGLSGIPASGKSSIARAIVNRVNDIYYSSQGDAKGSCSPIAILVGLDGWHLSRATLATFPDPEEAFVRRGAHWTFDAMGYTRFVQDLKKKDMSSAIITAPSFSHALKDPVLDDIRVEPHHRIVLLEGLYVFLALEPWKTAGELLDERWFVDVDMSDAMTRIVKRHVETGVTATLEEAKKRADLNDFPSRSKIGHPASVK
jgi:pantothenate kinase